MNGSASSQGSTSAWPRLVESNSRPAPLHCSRLLQSSHDAPIIGNGGCGDGGRLCGGAASEELVEREKSGLDAAHSAADSGRPPARAAQRLPRPAPLRRDTTPAGASAPALRSPGCRPACARGPRCQPPTTQKLLFAFSVSSKRHLRLACSVRKAIVCISLSNKLSNLLYQKFLELLLLLLSSKLPDFLSSSFQSYSLVCC